jgi:hypothetical protein
MLIKQWQHDEYKVTTKTWWILNNNNNMMINKQQQHIEHQTLTKTQQKR